MKTIKATLIVVFVAFLASMQMHAQSSTTSKKSTGTETTKFCSYISEFALQFPVFYLAGEKGINEFNNNLKKVIAKYEKSNEKLTSKSREDLVSAYGAMAESLFFCTLPLKGIDPNTAKGKTVLKEEVRKQKAKYKKYANQSTTLGQFIKKVQI
ncbi:MAG: hypothetical protein K2N05_06770 [Muribaculaceae bacterium]|nr:hypothetical protein [Muribaculaceae bacterium]